MLQNIKKYIKGWLLGILLFFIFISFAFWGVGDIFRKSDSYIAKVGKDKITRDEFLIEYQFRINAMENKDLSKNYAVGENKDLRRLSAKKDTALGCLLAGIDRVETIPDYIKTSWFNWIYYAMLMIKDE